MWRECSYAAFDLMRHYASKMQAPEMNHIAWYWVFLHCQNQKILRECAEQMKLVVNKIALDKAASPDDYPTYLDTYANLVYKMGEKAKALLLENKVLEEAKKIKQVTARELKEYESNLSKMQEDKPTWMEIPVS